MSHYINSELLIDVSGWKNKKSSVNRSGNIHLGYIVLLLILTWLPASILLGQGGEGNHGAWVTLVLAIVCLFAFWIGDRCQKQFRKMEIINLKAEKADAFNALESIFVNPDEVWLNERLVYLADYYYATPEKFGMAENKRRAEKQFWMFWALLKSGRFSVRPKMEDYQTI